MEIEELKKAYESIEVLKSLDLPVGDEQLEAIRNLEMRYIEGHVIPEIKRFLDSLVSRMINDWLITVSYDLNGQINCVIERKNSFSDKTVTYIPGRKRTNYDLTKYSIDGGEPLSKRRFVWTVVKKYVDAHPGITYEELNIRFPSSLNRSMVNGVVRTYA